MFPGAYVAQFGDKPAVITAGSGRTLTYRDLEARSPRLARYLYDAGLRRGDHLAVLSDSDGYPFLTDRKALVMISGGVSIYPQEIENALALHPKVFDVAVIGIPGPEMGESVAAIVHPAPGVDGSAALADELRIYIRERIAHYKVPRSFEFVTELPRTSTGKLITARLRAERSAATTLTTRGQ